jgi:hypothetical protein
MNRYLWERCPYYPDGRCPNRSLIDKAYLIPQILSPSELAAIKTACADCEVCRQDRRKHRRVQRPLEAMILDRQSGEELRGTSLNVSERGALIEIGDFHPFRVNQEIELRLWDEDGSCQSSPAVIKRVESTRRAISVSLSGGVRRRDRARESGSISRRSRMSPT